jgi:hypothetical protein
MKVEKKLKVKMVSMMTLFLILVRGKKILSHTMTQNPMGPLLLH